jgi:hypothetical protein
LKIVRHVSDPLTGYGESCLSESLISENESQKNSHDNETHLPYFTSSSLPLVYLNSTGIRLFIPYIRESKLLPEPNVTMLNEDSAIASLEIAQGEDIHNRIPPGDKKVNKTNSLPLRNFSSIDSHDTLIVEIASLSVNPQPMNPLPRNVVAKGLYRRAVHCGIVQVPGSEVEDRQYQVDLNRWSLSSGKKI